MAINNYKHNLNEPLVVKDLQITGTRVDNQNTLVFTKSIQLSADNTTGGGLLIGDDGDFVDLNNGYGSLRFASGIQVYSTNKGGSPVISLNSNGDISGRNLYVGSSDSNFIVFRGTTADGPGSYSHTYIGERLYAPSESSELFLFKGNDIAGASGPDRIRLAAAEIRFDTFTTPVGGDTFENTANSANLIQRAVITGIGSVGIGSATPQERLDVLGGNGFIRIGETYGGYNGITLNNSAADADYNILSSPSDRNLYFNRPSGWSINFRSNNGDQAVLNNSGNLLIGSSTDTGTASQRFQVTGGAYVSGNIGIGTTNPFSGQGGAVGLDVNRAGALIFSRNVGTSNESAVWAVDENFYSLPSYKGVGIKKHGTAAAGNVFGSIPNADLGTLAFQNTTNALIYTNGQTPIIFATASVERMRIEGATGNVGVSTSIARDSFQVGVGVTISSNGNATYTGIVTATGGIDVVGQSQLRRVAITTTSTNINMIAGRTYPYYSSITLTLPASPTAGDKVEIINRSGTSTAVVARNGSNIMGLAENMTIDLPDVGFTLIYTVAPDGWVIGK